jgi:hypothetical protein
MKRDYQYPHPLGGTAYTISPDGYLVRVHEYAPRHYVMTYGGTKKVTREYRRVTLRQSWQLFRLIVEQYREQVRKEAQEMETTYVRFISGKRAGETWQLVGEWSDIYSVEIASTYPTLARFHLWADPKNLELVS